MGYTHEKSNCPMSNTFMPLSALSTMSRSPICANSDWIHRLNSKNNSQVFFFKTILWHWQCFSSSVAEDCKPLKMDWNLGQQDTRTYNNQDIHTSRHWTYSNQDTCTYWFRSDNESAEKGDFEVVYWSRAVRSIRGRDWCVWIYEAGVYWLSYTT